MDARRHAARLLDQQPVCERRPPKSVTPVRNPIGFHVVGPLRGDQSNNLIGGARRLHEAGCPLALLTLVEAPELVGPIRAVSPHTLLLGRKVFGANDPSPFAVGLSGRDWFNRLWPAQPPGCDVYQFANEWASPDWDEPTVRRYARFYIELMDACDSHGVKCTVGDYSTGTPQPYHVPWLADMLGEAERRGHWLCYHSYSANNMVGQTDMSAGAEWFAMRWQMLVKDYPRLKVILGECGNSGEHLFRPETLALMQQFHGMLKPYPQVKGAAWWTLSNPDYPNGWKLDDFSPILSQVFDWLASI